MRTTLVAEARSTADTLAGWAKNNPPLVSLLRHLADAIECRDVVLREIAVDVVLADGLDEATQIAALWTVVRRHTTVARDALNVKTVPFSVRDRQAGND